MGKQSKRGVGVGGGHITFHYCYLARTKWFLFSEKTVLTQIENCWVRQKYLSPNIFCMSQILKLEWNKNFWIQIFFESVRLRMFDSVNARIFEPKYFLDPSDLDFSKIQIFLSPNMGISFCRPWIEACHGFLCKIERYADPRGAQNIWLICCLILAGQFEKVHFPKHKLVSYS